MADKRLCYYIPRDSFIEGRGYRVAIVTEDERGYVQNERLGLTVQDAMDIVMSSMFKRGSKKAKSC